MKTIIVLTLVVIGCLASTRLLFEVHEIPGEAEETHRKMPSQEERPPKFQELEKSSQEDLEPLHPTHRQYVKEIEIEYTKDPNQEIITTVPEQNDYNTFHHEK